MLIFHSTVNSARGPQATDRRVAAESHAGADTMRNGALSCIMQMFIHVTQAHSSPNGGLPA